ncbi:hypothetical protein [Mycolicibacterium flavescens]|uniref:hypothetical protein n=1 Tax=Mycolicibacterium flavescens TaxID=1776 RepID=UPI000B2DC501|nr:hypothetical protein [Mycolicibacterium flavescens]
MSTESHTDDVEVTEPESTGVELDADTAEPTERKAPTGVRRHLGAILLIVALVASAGVAAWLYFFQFRTDLQVNADAQKVALDAATTGTTALLSYSPDTLEQDFTEAKSRLTGDFLDYYTQFTEQIVTPAAKEKQVETSAAVVQAGVAEMNPDSAVVLVFVNQTTTSKENPDGAFAASAVKVGLTKVDDRWLINTFDPV